MNSGFLKKLRLLSRVNPLAEHAMEFVCEINDVVYINDSISISVEKTWSSLNSAGGNVILIIGGLDSRNDYSVLEELVVKKVKTIITLSSENTKLMKTFIKTGKEIILCDSVQDSVWAADLKSKPGDVVLFSPACPSYHPFDNYKNRGNDFKRAARSLLEKK